MLSVQIVLNDMSRISWYHWGGRVREKRLFSHSKTVCLSGDECLLWQSPYTCVRVGARLVSAGAGSEKADISSSRNVSPSGRGRPRRSRASRLNPAPVNSSYSFLTIPSIKESQNGSREVSSIVGSSRGWLCGCYRAICRLIPERSEEHTSEL